MYQVSIFSGKSIQVVFCCELSDTELNNLIVNSMLRLSRLGLKEIKIYMNKILYFEFVNIVGNMYKHEVDKTLSFLDNYLEQIRTKNT